MYYANIFDTKKNDSKTIWSNINTICSFNQSRKSKSNAILKLSVNNNIISSPSCIANALNDYFCNIGASIASQVPHSAIHYSTYLGNSVKSSFFCDSIEPHEVCNFISRLAIKKSSGMYYFNAQI